LFSNRSLKTFKFLELEPLWKSIFIFYWMKLFVSTCLYHCYEVNLKVLSKIRLEMIQISCAYSCFTFQPTFCKDRRIEWNRIRNILQKYVNWVQFSWDFFQSIVLPQFFFGELPSFARDHCDTTARISIHTSTKKKKEIFNV
jgi:hypothetical protein